MENLTENVVSLVLSCVEDCRARLITSEAETDLVIIRLESAAAAISDIMQIYSLPWDSLVNQLEDIIQLLTRLMDRPEHGIVQLIGRPKVEVSFGALEYFLSINLKVTEIAKMLQVSESTIFRRLREGGYSVRSSYTNIPDDELSSAMLEILLMFPNTGYKRMKGYLLNRGIKVTDLRVREAMRLVDPIGVYQRTLEKNSVIRRRQYYVTYSNQLWHIDGNLKLIRWGFVIRGAIDGKSRMVTYLDASDNNRADTHLGSFTKAVSHFGTPLRTRSDKGGENILIAKFMIENRGTGRGSHICGRSVHNQRIERYWREVRVGCTWIYRTLFETMEDDAELDIDNEKQLKLLHRTFLPRINHHLQMFMDGWNNHPLSTERNHTPVQIMLMNLPPPHYDLTLPFIDDIGDGSSFIHEENDLTVFNADIRLAPNIPELTSDDIDLPADFNFDRESNNFGYDIFIEAKRYLRQ